MGVLIDAYALVNELDSKAELPDDDKEVISRLKNPTAQESFRRKPYYLECGENKQKED